MCIRITYKMYNSLGINNFHKFYKTDTKKRIKIPNRHNSTRKLHIYCSTCASRAYMNSKFE